MDIIISGVIIMVLIGLEALLRVQRNKILYDSDHEIIIHEHHLLLYLVTHIIGILSQTLIYDDEKTHQIRNEM